MVAESQNTLTRQRNYFSQLLNVHGANDVRQTKIHTAEPLVPEPSASKVELAIKKLKNHKSPGIDQIPTEFIKAGGKTIRSEINKLIFYIWNKEELPEEWKESIIVTIYRKGDKTDFITYRGISILPTTYKILSNILLSKLTPYVEEMTRDHECGFRRNKSSTDRIFCIRKYLRKNGNKIKQCITSLQTSRKLKVQLGWRAFIIFSLSLVFP